MPIEKLLPHSVCTRCVNAASAAAGFQHLCREAQRSWTEIPDILSLMSHEEWKKGSLFINLVEDGKFQVVQAKKVEKQFEPLKVFQTKLKQKQRQEKAKVKKKKAVASDIICPDCETHFESHVDINIHLKYTKLRSCFICNEIVQLKDLKEHLLLKHKKTSYACNICSEIFTEKLKLQSHHRTTHKYKYYCVECKRSFRSAHSLSTHKFVHDRRLCNGCSKTFTNRICYTKHIKHCQAFVKEITQYTCDYCGKLYNGKDSLRMHIMFIHLRGRSFQCHKCAKGFFNEAHLKEHILTHDKVPDRFPCEFCDNKYSTRRGFEKHTRKHFEEGAMAKEYLKMKKNRNGFVVAN